METTGTMHMTNAGTTVSLTSPVNVMIVDDSAVIRGLYTNILDADPDIEVVASAAGGEMAINLLKRETPERLEVDVITLDIQMPDMDGLTALPEILKLRPDVKVIMSSSMTYEGAKETMHALSLGAADYIPKPDAPYDKAAMHDFLQALVNKVKALKMLPQRPGTENVSRLPSVKAEALETKSSQVLANISLRQDPIHKPHIIAIGSSTGGPQALTRLFNHLKGKKLHCPIMITQHMPAQFTALLAKQLGEVSGMPCGEAIDGEPLENKIYVAPGDYHMVLAKHGGDTVVELNQDEPENFCRPAVDPMLRSIAQFYGKNIMVIILTGMGSDGLSGCRQIVQQGGTVIAQDPDSSVVWGMPGAVANAGLCADVLPLERIPEQLIKLAQGQIA